MLQRDVWSRLRMDKGNATVIYDFTTDVDAAMCDMTSP